nr:hypothetical protein [uncultured Flavobacterium sp.]
MNKVINENVIAVLKFDKEKNLIYIDYEEITNHFDKTIIGLKQLCDKHNLDDIIKYLVDNIELNQLSNKFYKYCVDFDKPFQGFSASYEDKLKEVQSLKVYLKKRLEKIKNDYIEKIKNDDIEIIKNEDIEIIKNEDTEIIKKDDIEIIKNDISIILDKDFIKINNLKYNNIEHFLKDIGDKFELWSKAYSINHAYKKCWLDKSVLSFSHRLVGWSNPEFDLTKNFSMEIKTNFGFGRSSYFFVKLKYKGIDLIPFSEWIVYEFAEFEYFISYTRAYKLNNESWLPALNFSMDACNLSIINEDEFVNKYIIMECEKMVSGIENFFKFEDFHFPIIKDNSKINLDIDLYIFRSGKIVGSLDFISKIIELDHIISVANYIDRLEKCNKKLQPMIINLIEYLKIVISNLSKEKDEFKPEYDEIINKNIEFQKAKFDIIKVIENLKKSDPRDELSNSEKELKDLEEKIIKFNNDYYNKALIKMKELNKIISINQDYYCKIIFLNDKIISYFKL